MLLRVCLKKSPTDKQATPHQHRSLASAQLAGQAHAGSAACIVLSYRTQFPSAQSLFCNAQETLISRSHLCRAPQCRQALC